MGWVEASSIVTTPSQYHLSQCHSSDCHLSQCHLTLWLNSSDTDSEVVLSRTSFVPPHGKSERITTRGRYGVYRDSLTFQWSSAVQALTVALLRAAARGKEDTSPLLIGGRGTLAASLDHAFYKQTAWFSEMFGLDKNRRSLGCRIFIRNNPGRKRPGPVVFGLNSKVLSPSSIHVYLDDVEIVEPSRLETLAHRVEMAAVKNGGCEKGRKPECSKQDFESQARAENAILKPHSVVFISPAREPKPFYAKVLEGMINKPMKRRSGSYMTLPRLPSSDFDSNELWNIFGSLRKEGAKVDGVVLIPDDPDTNQEKILAFHNETRIPLVLFDVDLDRTRIPAGTSVPPFVGGNELAGGHAAGQMLAEHLVNARVEKPRILILKGTSTFWELRRIEGFKKGFETISPSVSYHETTNLYYDRFRAWEASRSVFCPLAEQGTVPIDGVFACNDDMAIGTRSAILWSRREGLVFPSHMKIVGYDGIEEMKAFLDAGDTYLLGTVNVRVEEQVSACLEVLEYMLAKGTTRAENRIIEPRPMKGRSIAKDAGEHSWQLYQLSI